MAATDAETVVGKTMVETANAKQRKFKKHQTKGGQQSVLCACESGLSFVDCHLRLLMPKARYAAEVKKSNTDDGKIQEPEIEQDKSKVPKTKELEIAAPKIKKAKVAQDKAKVAKDKVMGANDAKPDGLAYRENVIGVGLSTKILDFLMSISEEEWQVLKSSMLATKKRRIGYGRKGENPVPKELRGLLPAILASIMESMNDVEKALLAVYKDDYRFTINRYLPGMSLGLHYDTKAGKDAIVIGFTIGTTDKTFRSMKFQNKDGHEHRVITRDNSVYIFYGDAYTDWKHGSTAPTNGVVYSITIRANC